MDEKYRPSQEKWMKEMIDKELASQGAVLPPWQKHPELDRYSIGWRMGYGEGYMMAWDWWASQMKLNQLIEYFKKYLPIPLEWLDWVAYRCDNKLSDKVAGVRWLELQGLANFSEFMAWYEENK